MPKDKVIPWETREAVFLAYRLRGRKVKPTAEQFKVARSTVTAIIGEFKEMGFADRPRAKVSVEMLKEMQEQHLSDLASPSIGELNLGTGTGEMASEQRVLEDPLPVPDPVIWHLKATRAEKAIQELRVAAQDYLEREANAWRDLRLDLENSCGLTEKDSPVARDRKPHILPALRNKIHSWFLQAKFKKNPPPSSLLEWDIQPDQPLVLRLLNDPVAIGSPEEHRRVKMAIAEFLNKTFTDYQRRFTELEHLGQELNILKGIVDRTVAGVPQNEIRRGICPSCSYPEATLTTVETKDPGKRVTRRRIQR